ncbi:hypothetical protein J121_1888 [Qipengyuania citrea LAMA 915]|uniref:ATP-binding protein n=1 Tax=Qipengyuania citrea LAMA 915 TaxID=1306953 RepID=A0A0L1KGU7_9SPHN|nr:ATP-binding protein [Qipengyuania citrea]KNH03300.1 hypothetical protein J121_1888 [Qipengyuania citrea LAMA 915]
MTTLSENIKNRVDKLPKPSNYAQGLQPLFEAISNAKFAIYDRFDDEAVSRGRITIDIDNLRSRKDVKIRVHDNGIGMDAVRFDAFCIVDTDYKKARGGKGVGRLFWFDSFKKIRVESRYGEGDGQSRSFDFILREKEQISEHDTPNLKFQGVGTSVYFEGILDNEYASNFPKGSEAFLRYFTSHFISDFLMGVSPKIELTIDGESFEFPSSVRDLVVDEAAPVEWTSEKFGKIAISAFLCDPEASSGLEGRHQLHLLGDGRTVETRKIDGLLGLGPIEAEGRDDLCLHACVDAEFLDLRVNEGRTAFNIPEATLKKFTREVVEKAKETIVQRQIAGYKIQRAENYRSFIERYPIYDFDDPEQQLDRMPFGANDPEEFAAGLVKVQVRREEERYKQIQALVDQIDTSDFKDADFAQTVISAAEEIQRSEELSLAQHVARRKLVLELLEVLLRRYREVGDNEDHYLEKTVHSVLCPTNVSATDPSKLTSRRHDLWVVDERLTFSRAFASDKRIDSILADNASALRPDLIVWDLAYGLATIGEGFEGEPDTSRSINEMLVVELKKPMRTGYGKFEDNIEQQVLKYITQLKRGEIEGFERDRVRVNDECIFHCFVVADIVGDLRQQLSSWTKTPDGQGRYRIIEGDHRGSITVVQWNDLVNDAWLRNQATLNAAGLRRSPKLISEMQEKLKRLADG